MSDRERMLALLEWPTRSDSPGVTEQDRGHDTPCYIFGGYLNRHGYGMVVRGGKTFWVHRWVYEQIKGDIPDKWVIDHLCNVPACCNPAHLEAKTNAANVRRGKAKLTEEQVREIKRSPLGCRRAARELGVARETILGIRAGRRWKDIVV